MSFFRSSSLSRRHSSQNDGRAPSTTPPMAGTGFRDQAVPAPSIRPISIAGPFGPRRLDCRSTDDAARMNGKAMAWDPPVDFHLLDYVSEYDSNLMCPICRSPFVNPVVLSECDHTFCRDCLCQTWNQPGYTPGIPKGNCPTCRTSSKLIGRGPVSRILVNILDDLVVKCPKHTEGCASHMKRSEVQDHVKNYCGYSWMSCPSPSCELPIRRKDGKECLHFGVTCIDCRQTTHMANLETHWQVECPDRKVDCELCKGRVFYREIMTHAKETCPAITIPCTGASYGCTFRSKRGAINQHTKKCIFATLAPFFETQAKRVQEVEEQQEVMARKVQVLEGGLKSVEQIVQKSAEHLQTTSAADIDQVTGTNSDLREPHMQISTGTSTPAEDISASEWDSVSPIGHPTHAAPGVGFTSPYTHLLSLHESLRDELARITAALSDLDARHSMMILNENLRLKEDLTYLVGQVGGLGRQVGWLTSARLQQAEAASQRNAASASVASSAAAAARGVAGLARAAGFTGGSSTPPETTPATQAPAPANGPSISPVRMGRRLTDEGRTKL